MVNIPLANIIKLLHILMFLYVLIGCFILSKKKIILLSNIYYTNISGLE